MGKRKKSKGNKLSYLVGIIGLFAIGIFSLTLFAKLWGFLMQNATAVLWVTGSIIVALIVIRVLSPKKVKRSMFGSMRRLRA